MNKTTYQVNIHQVQNGKTLTSKIHQRHDFDNYVDAINFVCNFNGDINNATKLIALCPNYAKIINTI